MGPVHQSGVSDMSSSIGRLKKDHAGSYSMGELEKWAYSNGFHHIIGVDEVGRGPLAGPVVAAAVMLPKEHGIQGLKDSKQLPEARREHLKTLIEQRAEAWGLGVVEPGRIDCINIRRAALEAMSIAVGAMIGRVARVDLILVDGRDRFEMPDGYIHLEQRPIIKADARSESVAAASILAKVHRDMLMQQYHVCWPEYGFDRHKGYGTKAHKQAIQRHGTCEIHRLSFRGCEKSD